MKKPAKKEKPEWAKLPSSDHPELLWWWTAITVRAHNAGIQLAKRRRNL